VHLFLKSHFFPSVSAWPRSCQTWFPSTELRVTYLKQRNGPARLLKPCKSILYHVFSLFFLNRWNCFTPNDFGFKKTWVLDGGSDDGWWEWDLKPILLFLFRCHSKKARSFVAFSAGLRTWQNHRQRWQLPVFYIDWGCSHSSCTHILEHNSLYQWRMDDNTLFMTGNYSLPELAKSVADETSWCAYGLMDP